tara:strand:- start:47992 stop:49143 length:1152 start_codon:yes stop_codon:yes gene_type:complete
MKNNGTYNKGDSFIEIRGEFQNLENVFQSLQELKKNINNLSLDDPLRLAILDLTDSELKNDTERFTLKKHVCEEISRLSDLNDLNILKRYLRYRYQYDIYPKKKITGKYPPVIQIEPSSICNYRCVFCFQTDKNLNDKKNGHMGSMDLELFKQIIDEIEGNVEGVTLASRGEPFVNKKLPQMLDYMRDKFLAVKINTNASLLNEKISRSILESGIQTLVFSADAATPELYSKLRVNGKLENILRRIENFYEIKTKEFSNSKIITRVSGVKYNDTQDLDNLDNFWKKYVDQVSFVDYNPWENVYSSEKKEVEKACSDLWRRMFIWWDGKACPCDVDYLTTLLNLNVKNKTIQGIWNSEDYNFLRETHLNKERNKIDPCSRCVVV